MRGFVTSRVDYLVRQQLRPPPIPRFPVPRVLARENTPTQTAFRIHEAPHSSIRVFSLTDIGHFKCLRFSKYPSSRIFSKMTIKSLNYQIFGVLIN